MSSPQKGSLLGYPQASSRTRAARGPFRPESVGEPLQSATSRRATRYSLAMVRGIKAAAVLACALVLPAAASAKVWVVKGAGFGHGVGMSQYGAYGYAKHGFQFDQILTHYYTGTTIETTADKSVRVLLRDSVGSVAFHGANSACGTGIKPEKTYVAKRKGTGVALRSKKGRLVARCGAALTAAGSPTVVVAGKGTYRGSLEVRASGSSLQAINVVELEDYVRGVVSKESPSSW